METLRFSETSQHLVTQCRSPQKTAETCRHLLSLASDRHCHQRRWPIWRSRPDVCLPSPCLVRWYWQHLRVYAAIQNVTSYTHAPSSLPCMGSLPATNGFGFRSVASLPVPSARSLRRNRECFICRQLPPVCLSQLRNLVSCFHLIRCRSSLEEVVHPRFVKICSVTVTLFWWATMNFCAYWLRLFFRFWRNSL
jgi:hypothetical protein